MITQHAFTVEPWAVTEESLQLGYLAQAESVFALSNGHIGLRGNLDEGEPNGLPGTYLNGFYESIPLPYAEAINRVATEIGRIQQAHGAGAIGVLGGASLTTEKTYLLGKFARVCLKTPFIDYNGRLCMVSAGAANKKAFGIDRTTNPWSDMVGAEVIWVAGSNVAECSPITTNYIWQAREQGARIIMQEVEGLSALRRAHRQDEPFAAYSRRTL